MSSTIEKFIIDLKVRAEAKEVKLEFSNNKSLKTGEGIYCTGYFDGSESGTLAIATGLTQKIWLPILVHESCHMDQFLSGSRIWKRTDVTPELDALALIDLWIQRKIELNKTQLRSYIGKVFLVERDCERRSILKIKKYCLPIKIVEYTKKANSYLMLYFIVQRTRKWTKRGKRPYFIKDVWSKMPEELLTLKKCKEIYKEYLYLYKPILK